MNLQNELIDFTERARLLAELLDSDDILALSCEELSILEGMKKGLYVYCVILKRKIDREASIIKLKDERVING